MKKKIMSVLLSTAMVASMLAGCGSTTDEETSDATVAATKAAAQESAVAEEGGSETTGDGDLTSWILEDDTNMSGKVNFWIPFKGNAGMDDMIADFNKTYPNIEVTLNSYSNNSDGNMSVNTAIMSGEVDVLASFGLTQTWNRWSNNLFEDITDRVEKEGIDLVANWGTDAYKYEDHIYTLPCGGLKYFVSINMTDWNEAGLGELPTEWTWDEYLDACAKMTKVEDGKTVVYGGSDFHQIDSFTFPRQQVEGIDRYYDDSTGLSAFNDPIIVNSLKRELKAEKEDKIWYPKSVYRSDSIQVQTPFTQGETASAISPTMIRFIRDTENFPTDFITGFAPYPVEEKGQENYMAGANIFSHVGIATGCQNEEAAWAFTKWYATYGSKYLTLAGYMSTWKGTEISDLVSLVFGSEEEAAKIIDINSFKSVIGDTSKPTFVESHMTAYSDVTSAVQENAMYAFNDTMTAEDAMKAATEAADKAIQNDK